MEHGVKNKVTDIAVFTGPVLDEKDLLFIKPYKDTNIQIPLTFWKIIVWKKTDGKLYAVGFMMSQWEFIKDKLINGPFTAKARIALKDQLPDDYFENLKFSDHKTYQVPIKTIEKATGIIFNWRHVNFPYKDPAPTVLKATPLRKVHQFADVLQSILDVQQKGQSLTAASLKKELSTKRNVPPAEVEKLKNRGEGYTLKRFEIKNVTL